jgi:hypothetical protein
MTEASRQSGGAALPRPMGVAEILSAAFDLYRRYWRTLLAIAAMSWSPSRCCSTCSATRSA